jgi:hypothetical protein
VVHKEANVSEEYSASIFRVKDLSSIVFFFADFLLDLMLNPEDGGSLFLRNFGLSPFYTGFTTHKIVLLIRCSYICMRVLWDIRYGYVDV